jgi:hypothetical protein
MGVVKTANITEKTKKIIQFLKVNDLLDDEDITYCPKLYPFSYKEFSDAFEELDKISIDNKHDCSHEFEDCRAYFIMDDIGFIHRLMIGQGAALQLVLAGGSFVPFDDTKDVIQLI